MSRPVRTLPPVAAPLRAVTAATPDNRDRYADFLRVTSMLVVVLGHWLMTAIVWDGGELTGTNVLAVIPGLWLATWVFQVIPLFFFVGGFANFRAVESVERRGLGYAEFLTSRAERLLKPTAVFIAVWLALPPLLTFAGAPADQVNLIGKLLPQPLWFLATYLMVIALAPVMVRLHRRYGLRALAALAATAAGVDAVRFTLGQPDLGYVNLLVVWLTVQQFGFLYADGTLARRSRHALAAMAAAGLGALTLLVASGLYPPSMVTLPGATESNMNPPTVCMLALTVWQVALVMLARERMTRWLAKPRPWTVVVAAGSLSMSVYLWHMTALAGLLAIVTAVHLPLPEPGGALWWLTRPLWLAALAVLLAPLLLAFSRWERPARRQRSTTVPGTRGAVLAASLGLVYAVVALFGFVTSGFAPLPDPAGSALLVLRTDPLQSALCLTVALLLLHAARTGTAATRTPWLQAAAVLAFLLAPAIPGVADTPLQVVATAPANWLVHGAALVTAASALVVRSRRTGSGSGGGGA